MPGKEDKVEGKTNRFIVKPLIRDELKYHDIERAKREIGLGYIFMDTRLVEEADVHIGLQEVKSVPPDFESFIEPHTHEVSQCYAIIGELTIEVTLEGERHEVEGPASIFIPPGMEHTFRPVRGNGYVVIVMTSKEYV